MAPALHSALGNSRAISPFPPEPPLSPLPVSLSAKVRSQPQHPFLILLTALAVIPCQNSHLYSIHGPSVTPGGDIQYSPTAQCSPTYSLASALQSSPSLYTSSLRMLSGKESMKPLKTNTTSSLATGATNSPDFPRSV